MTTGIVSLTSDIVRKAWMREGMVQAASTSFWAPYTGRSFESVVYQETNISASEGHTVVFDFDGNIAAKAYKNKATAYGNGIQKLKFSDKITVDRYRWPVDNGDKFDGVNIGDLSINEHMDSRRKLSDNWIRIKDQALFDAAQGFLDNAGCSHIIVNDASSTNLGYSDLKKIERILKTGSGYYSEDTDNTPGTYSAITTRRAPLRPFYTADKKPVWLVIIDSYTAENIFGNATVNAGIIPLAQNADMRGRDNMVFTGVLGKIGQLVFIEAPTFFGTNDGATTGIGATANNGIDDVRVEIAGLREFDGDNGAWAGCSSYSMSASDKYSRNLILGAGALQIAMGMEPDYRFKTSQDFDITSESALQVWFNAQKTNLTAENTDYDEAKIASLDLGVIAWDVMTST